MKILSMGAEAIIYKINNTTLLKERVKKGYRIKQLDESLRKTRTKKETNLMRRASYADISVPKIFEIKTFSFKMDNIDGTVLRDYITNCNKKELKRVFEIVGKQINSLHKKNIVHGDLTTSNMIVKDDKVFFIDFSLGNLSNKIEDKAVDLHLIKQALIAKHNKIWEYCYKIIISKYENKHVLERLKGVEKRGKKK